MSNSGLPVTVITTISIGAVSTIVIVIRRVGRGASVLPGSPPPFPLLSHTMPLLASFSLTVEQEMLINS